MAADKYGSVTILAACTIHVPLYDGMCAIFYHELGLLGDHSNMSSCDICIIIIIHDG